MEYSPGRAKLVSDLLAELDLERLHPPAIAVNEESSHLADRLPVGANYGSPRMFSSESRILSRLS